MCIRDRVTEIPVLGESKKLEVLDISHNQIKSARNLSLLTNLRNLNISFNLLKSQQEFCVEIIALKDLIRLDSRKNVYNSLPLSKAEIEDYRSSIISSLPQTLVCVDGETVRDCERENLLHCSCASKRLFKLTDTFDSEVFRDVTEVTGERIFRNMSNCTYESAANRESDRENRAPNCEEIAGDTKDSVGKIRDKFMSNIQEFDEALSRLKRESKMSEREGTKSKGMVVREPPEELNVSKIVATPESVQILREQRPHERDETIELVRALDVSKDYCTEEKSVSTMKKLKKQRNITDEFRKVFKEELDSLRYDLKDKIDKYRESKSISMRSGDATLYSNQEKSTESRRAMDSITRKCEDNEKELKRVQEKMKDLARKMQAEKESEREQKKELNRSISALKQKVELIETHSRSLSFGNNQYKRKGVMSVCIQTDNPSHESLAVKQTIKNTFRKYAKEDNKIHAESINSLISCLSLELKKHKSKRQVQSIISSLVKAVEEDGCIDLNAFRAELNSKITMDKDCASTKSTPSLKHEKITVKERKYMKKLQEILFRESFKAVDKIMAKLFLLNKHKVKTIYEVAMNVAMKDFFRYKLSSKEAKILFFAGKCPNQAVTKESIKDIYLQDLTFTSSLSLVLQHKKHQQNSVLVLIVMLGRIEKAIKKTAEEADTIYDPIARTYTLKSPTQVSPLFVIDYY
eukprot:TRINITY_DN1953_c0_g1_i12.p1 TRINITY_DN1953_c0_g1~~TRINITY_DN1953_c0_g1_i12.p1  ORF type:complete len:693 (+),score=150.26 TRINITY_DN1953_c0_g1_i12:73-2151(+)